MRNRVARPHGQDDLVDGVQDQLRLLMWDVMAAVGSDHQPPPWTSWASWHCSWRHSRSTASPGQLGGVGSGRPWASTTSGIGPQQGAAQRYLRLAFADPDVDPSGFSSRCDGIIASWRSASHSSRGSGRLSSTSRRRGRAGAVARRTLGDSKGQQGITNLEVSGGSGCLTWAANGWSGLSHGRGQG